MPGARVTARVVVRDHGWKQVKANARSLNGRGIEAGILAKDASVRGRSRDWNGNPIPGTARVIDYAVWNEFGTEKIPSRPFMRRTADANKAEIGDAMAKTVDAFVFGKGTAANSLHDLGKWYADLIRRTIDTAIRWATPLSPVTAAKKGHDLPLIDFGTLRRIIDYALVGKRTP